MQLSTVPATHRILPTLYPYRQQPSPHLLLLLLLPLPLHSNHTLCPRDPLGIALCGSQLTEHPL